MVEFLFIILHIILPIFILIALGALLHHKFKLDLYTLAKLNIYYLVPALIFVKLYEAQFSIRLLLIVLLFFVLYISVLLLISFVTGKLFGLSKSMRTAFSNSIVFYNSGNYGVPLNDLVFKHDPFSMSIQVLILTFQNIFTFSYGVFVLRSMNGNRLKAALGYVKMPVFYAMILGITLHTLRVTVPDFIMAPVQYISDSLIAIALLTLGAQIANLRVRVITRPMYLSLVIRLIAGPLLAYGVVLLMHLHGVLASGLVISSAMPTSVNSSIIAQEYKNEPEFAAQTVWLSTLLSSLTVSLVIYCTRFIH